MSVATSQSSIPLIKRVIDNIYRIIYDILRGGNNNLHLLLITNYTTPKADQQPGDSAMSVEQLER